MPLKMENSTSAKESGYLCPVCSVPLTQSRNDVGIFWCCPSCDGRMLSLSLLRKTVLREAINEIWQQAQESAVGNKCCAECRRPMRQATGKSPLLSMTVDVCILCTLVWFDPHEFEALPPSAAVETPQEELPQAAREALAIAMVEEMGQQYEGDDESPEAGWQLAVGMMGLPLETEVPECVNFPLITLLLAAIVLAMSVAGFHYGPGFVAKYALIPAHPGRYFGLTLLSSFFIHTNFLLLLGNLYFLVVFGDNVEDSLGKWRYLLLLLLATLAASVAHIAGNSASHLPYIGASGGISGIMACYALLYPDARLSLFLRFLRIFRWVTLPAWVLFIWWICWQVFAAWKQGPNFTNVSIYAQLGGAMMGAIFWLALHRLKLAGVNDDSEKSTLL